MMPRTGNRQSLLGEGGLKPNTHRIAAIYGANASGKTNVLKALEYMKNAVRNSQNIWPAEGPISRDPFLLDSRSKKEPSFFEAELELEGVPFRYAFTLNDQEILEERLDSYPSGKRQLLLRRERQDFIFGNELTGDNQAIRRLTRPNSLFLSAAAHGRHPLLLPLYRWFAKQVVYVPGDRRTLRRRTAEMCRNQSLKPVVLRLLRTADPTVTGLKVREEELLGPLLKYKDAKRQELLGDVIGLLQKLMATARQEDPGAADLLEKRLVLAVYHSGAGEKGVPLEEARESDGTLSFLQLLESVLQTLRTGGMALIDEVEAGLHPLLALRIVRLFSNPKLAGRAAQIIFTTLDSNLLNVASLKKDQVWFTEKDTKGRTHLYSLTDFMPEKNEKLSPGYLQGRYGPVPFLGWSSFRSKLDASSDR